MESGSNVKMNLTELDKAKAISTFSSVFLMAKLKMRMKRYLNYIRARIAKRKQANV